MLLSPVISGKGVNTGISSTILNESPLSKKKLKSLNTVNGERNGEIPLVGYHSFSTPFYNSEDDFDLNLDPDLDLDFDLDNELDKVIPFDLQEGPEGIYLDHIQNALEHEGEEKLKISPANNTVDNTYINVNTENVEDIEDISDYRKRFLKRINRIKRMYHEGDRDGYAARTQKLRSPPSCQK